MADKVTSWKFAEDFPIEPTAIAHARAHAHELGVECVTPAVGAVLASYAAAAKAEAIVELGTGAGISGLWMLHGAPSATLTTIDPEIAHHDAARIAFDDAGIPSRQVRLISKRAGDVIDKLADASYDLVFIDADADNVNEYVDHATRITRDNGIIIIANVLHSDRTANPAARDAVTQSYRELLDSIEARDAVHASLITTGDGLLVLVKK